MKKKLLIVALCLFALCAAALFYAHSWLSARFEKDALIAQMEQWWDCRASIESSTVNLLASPATVELRGLKLALSDDEVSKPLSQRHPFPDHEALIMAEQVTLAVTLQDLISRRYQVEKLLLQNVAVKTVIDSEGDGSLDLMFDSPEQDPDNSESSPSHVPSTSDAASVTTGSTSMALIKSLLGTQSLRAQIQPSSTVAESDSAASSPPSNLLPKHKNKKRKKEKKVKKPFMAKDLGLALNVREAMAQGVSFEAIDYKNQTHLSLQNVNLTLTDIDVDPAKLSQHNRCNVDFSGNLKTAKIDPAEITASFTVEGKGVWHPFHPETGEWFPDLGLNITVKKDGILGGTSLESQLRPKDHKKLMEYGLDLSGLAMGGKLQQDLITEIHALGSKLIIKKDTELAFPDYSITLMAQSWLNSAEDLHRFSGRFTASSELSHRVLSGAEAKLAEKYGKTLASIAQATVNAAFMDEQKRLVIPIRSRGTLSSPEVSLDGAIADITDSLKNTGKSLLESLFKN